MRIFKPRKINMHPPRYSAYFWKIDPNFLPNKTQQKESPKVMIPIHAAAQRIGTCKKAKLTPIAKASMLVAIPNKRTVFKGMECSISHSSSCSLPSLIMLMPMIPNRIKAIQ